MTDDRLLIQQDAQRRGVTRLCHFTPGRKLMNMLRDTQAILPTTDLRQEFEHLLDPTDPARLDGRPDHICCSVQYPNAGYFQRVVRTTPNFPDWVILGLNPRLLWERPVLFSPRNAAAQYGAFLQEGWAGWQSLFQEAVQGAGGRMFTRDRQMTPNCPTDNQAEVLIPGRIPLDYIEAIIVPNQDALEREQLRFSMLKVAAPPAMTWRIAPDLFDTAFSWALRQGVVPQETVVPQLPNPGT